MTHTKPEEKKEDSFYTGPLRPFPYSFKGHRKVPDHIKKPDYAKTGKPSASRNENLIPMYTDPEDVAKLRKACLIAR
jgi:methionyl aminopeptidase